MPGIESECQTERSKTIARWFGIAILTALVYRQRQQGVVLIPDVVFWLILGGIAGVNLFHSLYLYRIRSCPLFYKYISVGLDLIFVTVLIGYSGFNESPYFYVYFLLLVSNCIRYGLVMSLYIAVLVNVLYTVTLSVGAEALRPTVLGGEGLKILAFWGVALYGGVVSARMRRDAYEIAAYEETIAELKAELNQQKQQLQDKAERPATLPSTTEPAPQTIAPITEPASKPTPAEHLPLLKGEAGWIRGLMPLGVVLLALAVLLTFVAPNVLWFLLYPVLIVGAVAALATAAAWLLRYLHI